ncbi:MAG: ATPase, T2SS/T4P/T4SS family [Acidimicrobiales bacterium]
MISEVVAELLGEHIEPGVGTELSRYVALSLLGLGPLELPLNDARVWEIIVNNPRSIYLKTINGAVERVRHGFFDDEHVLRIVARLLDRSDHAHRSLDPSEGIQDAQLYNGARMHIVHRDLAKGGHLLINIRKFIDGRGRDLTDLVRGGTLSDQAAEFLVEQVRRGATIICAGAPGAGKTTLLSALVNALPTATRVVTAEEVFEANLTLRNVASMQTRPRRSDRSEVTLRELTTAFLRMSPDAVIVGEVRDREVLPFLMTLSSGVQGFTSLHSKSARHALQRLRFLAQLSGIRLEESAITQLVSESVDLVVFLRRTHMGVRVAEIAAVEDAQRHSEGWNFASTLLFQLDEVTGSLRATGERPARLAFGSLPATETASHAGVRR